MMFKPAILSVLAAFPLYSIAASEDSSFTGTTIPIPDILSPQVCQFSLSTYSGTVSSGSTAYFTVGLSCPQEKDVYATVVAFVNQQHVASEVVKVPAGSTRSERVCIVVGASYNGESYRLVVQ